MKHFFSLIGLLFMFQIILAQIPITADSIKTIQAGKRINIYLTATWCSPCMAKLKFEDEKLNKDSSDLNILIFDRVGFSDKKFKKLGLKYFDSSNTFLIPYKYYTSKGFIQINSSDKSIRNFFKDILRQYPKSEPVKSFWIDNAITITKENKLFLRKEELVSSTNKCNTRFSSFLSGYPERKDETENRNLCCNDKKLFSAHPWSKVPN